MKMKICYYRYGIYETNNINDDSKLEHTSVTDKLRASAQINRLSATTDTLGTTLSKLGEIRVMISAVQVELQRQTKGIVKGSQISPNIYRKQERRLCHSEEQALRHQLLITR